MQLVTYFLPLILHVRHHHRLVIAALRPARWSVLYCTVLYCTVLYCTAGLLVLQNWIAVKYLMSCCTSWHSAWQWETQWPDHQVLNNVGRWRGSGQGYARKEGTCHKCHMFVRPKYVIQAFHRHRGVTLPMICWQGRSISNLNIDSMSPQPCQCWESKWVWFPSNFLMMILCRR